MVRLATALVFGLAVGSGAWAQAPAKPAAPASKGGATANCNEPAMHMCWDYSGQSAEGRDFTKKGCEQTKAPGKPPGVWTDGKSCPSAGRVGRCTRTMLGVTTVINFYAPNTAAQAENHCEMIGTPYTPN